MFEILGYVAVFAIGAVAGALWGYRNRIKLGRALLKAAKTKEAAEKFLDDAGAIW